MCGLAGVAGNTNMKLRDAFLDLLIVTQLRGRDSTGVFSVKNDNDVSYCKEVGPPDNLFDRKSFDETLRGVPKIMAGHCRAKTVGENNRANAHPYDFDNLIGMHNGTLRNYYSMEGHDYHRTDSHCLYYNIDRYGVDEVIPKISEDGAWALVWWDKNEKKLNFLRNDKRPLWFAWTKDKTAVLWASEPWMFSAVGRTVELWDGKEEGKEPSSPYFQLPPDTLWSFTVASYVKPGERFLTFHQPREVKAEKKAVVSFFPPSTDRSGTTKDKDKEGGEVSRPFHFQSAYERFQQRQKEKQELNDDVSDLSAGEATTSPPSEGNSQKTSSNVLDFRPESRRHKNSQKSTLSLPQRITKDSPRSSNESGTGGFKGCLTTESTLQGQLSFPRVSIRKVAGIEYITNNDTSDEISVQQFEERTGGKCTHCHKPIGDLTEVAAFTNKVMSAFVCNECIREPKIAIVG